MRFTLDKLNTGAITIEDRDGNTRWTISIGNHIADEKLSLSINTWDADNYGTPNEKHKDVAVSYNNRKDR